MPNINELLSPVDAESDNPSLPFGHPFTNVQSSSYWSSTSEASFSFFTALQVDLLSNFVSAGDKGIAQSYLWPTRSGSAGIIQLPKTGQTTCYDTAGTVVSCGGTGQDGEIQAGVPLPNLRFTDNSDGTVTDNLTGLIWTKDANLPGTTTTWQQALDYVAGMNAGTNSNFGYTDLAPFQFKGVTERIRSDYVQSSYYSWVSLLQSAIRR